MSNREHQTIYLQDGRKRGRSAQHTDAQTAGSQQTSAKPSQSRAMTRLENEWGQCLRYYFQFSIVPTKLVSHALH